MADTVRKPFGKLQQLRPRGCPSSAWLMPKRNTLASPLVGGGEPIMFSMTQPALVPATISSSSRALET